MCVTGSKRVDCVIQFHLLPSTRTHTLREIEYRYHVRHVPYIAYSMKQVQSLASREEAMANFGSRQASWRILRKIYALRVEFEQAGSLGELTTKKSGAL